MYRKELADHRGAAGAYHQHSVRLSEDLIVEIDGDDAVGAHHQRVSIGACARDDVAGDVAIRTCPIVDDHLHAEQVGELLSRQTADDVDGSARRIGDDQAYRTRRITLRTRIRRSRPERGRAFATLGRTEPQEES